MMWYGGYILQYGGYEYNGYMCILNISLEKYHDKFIYLSFYCSNITTATGVTTFTDTATANNVTPTISRPKSLFS